MISGVHNRVYLYYASPKVLFQVKEMLADSTAKFILKISKLLSLFLMDALRYRTCNAVQPVIFRVCLKLKLIQWLLK